MVQGVVATVVVGVDSDVLPGGALGRGAAWRERVSRREGIDIKEVAARGRRRATAVPVYGTAVSSLHRERPARPRDG